MYTSFWDTLYMVCWYPITIYIDIWLVLITRRQSIICSMLGLPYLERQKSGQWMATLHEAKFMGFSTIFITKSGRSNSLVALIVLGNDEVLKKGNRGDLQKKKKGKHLFGSAFCVIFRPKTALFFGDRSRSHHFLPDRQ